MTFTVLRTIATARKLAYGIKLIKLLGPNVSIQSLILWNLIFDGKYSLKMGGFWIFTLNS